MGCTPIPADQLFDVLLAEAVKIVKKDYEGRIEALEAENKRLIRDRAALAKQLSIAERKLKSVTKLWHDATAALKGAEQ